MYRSIEIVPRISSLRLTWRLMYVFKDILLNKTRAKNPHFSLSNRFLNFSFPHRRGKGPALAARLRGRIDFALAGLFVVVVVVGPREHIDLLSSWCAG